MLRTQIRDIARQLSHFEERIKINNLLNEIREDLQKRIEHIKTVLGEEKEAENTESDLEDEENDLLNEEFLNDEDSKQILFDSKKKKRKFLKNGHKKERKERDKGIKMLQMTNKTPFWNEQSQVYQVTLFLKCLKT